MILIHTDYVDYVSCKVNQAQPFSTAAKQLSEFKYKTVKFGRIILCLQRESSIRLWKAKSLWTFIKNHESNPFN